ncbi:hypothetical protein RhiirC2_795120 [Rhizophagus irregularis]|uniref:Uncharacterized protein n=1 Tax=Rhizophagus irregularis TaxID=588596 RepID=A0A2N1MC77_9GLOM|nr:hypothetical protein RhiirC2_795120 [Rhizophagus irregularis]
MRSKYLLLIFVFTIVLADLGNSEPNDVKRDADAEAHPIEWPQHGEWLERDADAEALVS